MPAEYGWLPLGEEHRERSGRGKCHSGDPEPDPSAAGQPVRPAREREEQAGDGAGERAAEREREPAAVMTALQREHRRERERDAHRERQPADQQVGGGAGGEHERAPAGPLAEVPARDPLEQHGRRDGGEDPDDPHAQQRAEWREEDRVRGRVVAAVPVGVEQREALAVEQTGAVDLSGEIRRRRGEREPGERERRGEQPGRDARRAPGAGSPLRQDGSRHRPDARRTAAQRCFEVVTAGRRGRSAVPAGAPSRVRSRARAWSRQGPRRRRRGRR